MPMIYRDRIYGKLKIEEPVILELIKSPSLQRLKGIDQAGYFIYFWPSNITIDKPLSRFEHSLGVFILLRNFGASLESQIAGLIHDVSHGVFSHCIDYALDEGSEREHSYQDIIFEKFVRNSEIPNILKNYGFDVDYILDEHNFPLLEKSLPDLCADRIDYALRTAIVFKEITQKIVDYFIQNLVVKRDLWIFKNFKSAQKFAQLFLKLNVLYFAGFPSALMFRTVGDLLKHALQKDYLSKKDFWTSDKDVLEKIKKYLDRDEKLKLLFERMNNKIEFKNDPKDYDVHVFCKSRIVDPLCRVNDKIKKVSEINKKWKKIIEQESKPKEYFIKFEK